MPARPTLPREDHVARYVNKQRCVLDDTGIPIWVLPAAFELRAQTANGPEKWLSTTWLEFFGRDLSVAEQCHHAVAAMRAGKLDPRPSGAIAILHIGHGIARARELGARLRATHEPEQGNGNPAYSPIRGYKPGCPESFLDQVFARGACIRTIPVRALSTPTALQSPREASA